MSCSTLINVVAELKMDPIASAFGEDAPNRRIMMSVFFFRSDLLIPVLTDSFPP